MGLKFFITLMIFFLIDSVFLFSQSKSGDLPVIDFSKNYPKHKEQILQDIVDIEYVRLETTDEVLLSGVRSMSDISKLAHISDKYIIVYEMKRGDIFVFNRNGKIISHFNQRGQSGREYYSIKRGVVFDEKNEEIFVCGNTVQVYSINGVYKRTLRIDSNATINVYNFDDETLLVYEDAVVYNGTITEKYTKKNPYRLVSKKDGSLVNILDIHFPKRISNHGTKIISYPSSSLHYGQDFVIADMSSDTIYLLTQNKDITPIIARKPSIHASESRKIWSTHLTTDKYIFFGIIPLDFNSTNQGGKIPVFMFEFETGETSAISIINAEYAMKPWSPYPSPTIAKNMTAELMDVSPLIEAYKKKQLKGEFEKFVSTLSNDDNPIVMIIKFK